MDDWWEKAACKGWDWQEFFTSDDASDHSYMRRPPPHIQEMCNSCPVEGQCLAYALKNGEHGVWGGTTDMQRKRIMSSCWRVHCIKCSSRTIVRSPSYAICMACGLSWRVPRPPAES